jgi:hypothetical protein
LRIADLPVETPKFIRIWRASASLGVPARRLEMFGAYGE